MNLLENLYLSIDIIKKNYNGNEEIQIFVLVLLALIVLRLFSNLLTTGNIVFFIISLPGTFVHELAHYIVGFILLGKPSNFTIIPKKDGDGYTLGSVSFLNITNLNALPIGLAPLTLIPIGMLSFSYSVFYLTKDYWNNNIYIPIILGIIVYSIFTSFIPSPADYRILWSKKLGLLGYIVVGLVLINQYVVKLEVVYKGIKSLF